MSACFFSLQFILAQAGNHGTVAQWYALRRLAQDLADENNA